MNTIKRTLHNSGSARSGPKRLDALLADYCLLTGTGCVGSMLAGQDFTVDGAEFRLAQPQQPNPDVLCIRCVFGKPAAGREAECYLGLLNANTLLFDGMSPMMALCSETGSVICSMRLPLRAFTAQALHECLRRLAIDAKSWRDAQQRRSLQE